MHTLIITFIISQFPLGVSLRDEVEHEDMIEIMSSLQQCVHMVHYTAKETDQSNAEEVIVEFYL